MHAWQVSVFRTGRAQLRAAESRPPAGIALSPQAWCALTSKLQRLLTLVSHTLNLPPHAAAATATAPTTAAPAPTTTAPASATAATDALAAAECAGGDDAGIEGREGCGAEAEAEAEDGGEPPRLLIYTQWLAHVKYVAQLLRRAGVP